MDLWHKVKSDVERLALSHGILSVNVAVSHQKNYAISFIGKDEIP